MFKQAIVVFFLVPVPSLFPSLAQAECGFAGNSNEMTIVVGKSDKKCFDSGNFRETFRTNLSSSVKTLEAKAAAAAPAPAVRRPRPKLSLADLPVQQAVLYRGQDPKR